MSSLSVELAFCPRLSNVSMLMLSLSRAGIARAWRAVSELAMNSRSCCLAMSTPWFTAALPIWIMGPKRLSVYEM